MKIWVMKVVKTWFVLPIMLHIYCISQCVRFNCFQKFNTTTALPKAMSGKNVLFHAQASRDPGTALRFSSDKGATFWAYFKHADLQHQSHGQRGPGGHVPTAGKKGIQGLLFDSWS